MSQMIILHDGLTMTKKEATILDNIRRKTLELEKSVRVNRLWEAQVRAYIADQERQLREHRASSAA